MTTPPPCHPRCAHGPDGDHPGHLGYRCRDDRGMTLAFPGEAWPPPVRLSWAAQVRRDAIAEWEALWDAFYFGPIGRWWRRRIPWPTEELVLPHSDRPGRHEAARRRRSLSDGQEADIATRYAAGATIADLADLHGVTSPTVRRALDRRGVPIRPRGPRPNTLARLAATA